VTAGEAADSGECDGCEAGLRVKAGEATDAGVKAGDKVLSANAAIDGSEAAAEEKAETGEAALTGVSGAIDCTAKPAAAEAAEAAAGGGGGGGKGCALGCLVGVASGWVW
jgi:hypothetical protein